MPYAILVIVKKVVDIMANSKLIVVEGAQGTSKTTCTDYIRHTLSYTNLYRLAGTSDSTKQGYYKAKNMYESLLNYLATLENNSINLVFDRTFFTEENYCRLGKKEYSFTDEYTKLLERFSKLDFEIYYITLYLKDEQVFSKRLNREGKALFKGSEYAVENSISQQRVYLEMAEEIKEKYPNIPSINIDTDKPLELVEEELRDKIGY